MGRWRDINCRATMNGKELSRMRVALFGRRRRSDAGVPRTELAQTTSATAILRRVTISDG